MQGCRNGSASEDWSWLQVRACPQVNIEGAGRSVEGAIHYWNGVPKQTEDTKTPFQRSTQNSRAVQSRRLHNGDDWFEKNGYIHAVGAWDAFFLLGCGREAKQCSRKNEKKLRRAIGIVPVLTLIKAKCRYWVLYNYYNSRGIWGSRCGQSCWSCHGRDRVGCAQRERGRSCTEQPRGTAEHLLSMYKYIFFLIWNSKRVRS